jgi:lysozyme
MTDRKGEPMTITVTALTPRIAAYCCSVEGIVLEAYKDNAKPPVWTWAGGISTKSGFDVLQYKDKPQSLETCLRATVDLMRRQYWPAVLAAFAGHDLSEVQLAAALSFEWHYGAIARAEWVGDWCAGKRAESRASFMNWTDHGNALERAKIERAMFFDGDWPADLRAPVYSVAKPSYRPAKAKRVDVLPILTAILYGDPT